MAKTYGVPETIVRRLYEAVQISKKQGLYGGHSADFIERHLGRRLRGSEFSVLARAKKHLLYDPPGGYEGPKPRGPAAEPTRWFDERLMKHTDALVARACANIKRVTSARGWKEDRYYTPEGKALLAAAAEDLYMAAEAAEQGGRRIRAGTLRERARAAERIADNRWATARERAELWKDADDLDNYEPC